TTCALSTGARPPARRRRCCARGGRSAIATSRSSSTRVGRPRRASATRPGSTRPSRPRCCSRRSPTARGTTCTSPRSTPAPARAATAVLRPGGPGRARHVAVIVATGRTAAARVGDETRLDATFEAALLLAALANRAGDHVHVLAFDRVVRARVTGVDGPRLVPEISDALAGGGAQLIDPAWDRAVAEAR